MTSGEWSILIISNNGDADPIDYQREFSLSVGTQATTTFTPTVTATVVSTPVTTVYSTVTDTVTTTLVAKTTTKHALVALNLPKLTSILLPSIHVVTQTAHVVTHTLYRPAVATAVVTSQAICSPPHPNFICDPQARITANIITSRSSMLDSANSVKFARAIRERRAIDDETKAAYILERRGRLAEAARIAKRSPDAPTATVTDTNTADYITSTSVSTAGASTVSLKTTTHVTSTSTPPVVTVTKALLNINLSTILHNLPAITVTDWTVATQTATKSVPWT